MDESGSQPSPPVTRVGSMDMGNLRDLQLLRKSLAAGWKVNPARKAAYFGALDKAIEYHAKFVGVDESAKIVVAANAILQQEQRAMLADIHHLESPNAPKDEIEGEVVKPKQTLDYDGFRNHLKQRANTAK